MTPEDCLLERLCVFHKKARHKEWFESLKLAAERLAALKQNRQISVLVRTDYPELHAAIRKAMVEEGLTSKMIKNRMVYALLYGTRSSTCHNPNCAKPIYKFTDYFCYAAHCGSACAGYTILQKATQTLMERHGVTRPQQLKAVRDKTKATCRAKYGFEYTAQVPDIKTKSAASKRDRTSKQKQETRKKQIKTSLERYGVKHYSMLLEAREASRLNLIARTQEERLASNELSRKTRLKKYGAFNPESASRKAQETYEKRTGYTHQLRNPKILDAMLSKRYKRTSITDCNGRQHKVQGFEHHVISRLADLKPRQIWTAAKDVGAIDVAGTGRGTVYFPDIRIVTRTGVGVVLEVKSTYTIKDPKNLPKFVAADKQLSKEGGLFRIALVHSADHIETLTTRQWKRRYA